jgi:hypothetical protein
VVLLTTFSAWGSPATRAAVVATRPELVHPPDQLFGDHPDKVKGGGLTAKSSNWAGFAVSAKGVTFSDVVGSWVQPAVTCQGNAQQDSSFWVGIDGYAKGAGTVEQTGTDSDCNKGTKKNPGGPHYYAWWTMYPAPSVDISAVVPADTVTPGDSMTAQVSASGGSFTLTLTDAGKWTYSTTQSSSAAPQSSAEWIAEAPSGCNGCASVKLADFGSVMFDGLSVTASAAAFNYTQISMYKGKNPRALTTATSTSSFTVNWEHN